jgi:hypothetical protein
VARTKEEIDKKNNQKYSRSFKQKKEKRRRRREKKEKKEMYIH